MEFLKILSDNSACIYSVAIVATILALAVSTRYSLRNLLNIRSVGATMKESPTSSGKRRGSGRDDQDDVNDATGNDGDDEAEGDEIEDPVKPISPRYPDPVDYCEHIQGEIKRVQQNVAARSIAETLSEDQLNEEREVQRKQLADIFRLMQEQEERFGIKSMDDMQEQMKLYSV